MLKMNTVAVAQESERGIVDIETLQKANADLIETLDSVRQDTGGRFTEASRCRGRGSHA